MGNCTDGKVFCVQELASAELRFETSSDGVPLAVLTKGEVPMMRVVAELMIAANAAVARQPVAVGIDAEHGGFMHYRSGVMGGKCGNAIDHSVLAVGYGNEVFPPPPPPGLEPPTSALRDSSSTNRPASALKWCTVNASRS